LPSAPFIALNAFQGRLARQGVVDHGRRIIPADHAAGHLLFQRRCQPRRVNALPVEFRQLRAVAADELTVGIELFGLCDRIEDAEPRLRVAAGRCSPLPAAVVGGQIEVVQRCARTSARRVAMKCPDPWSGRRR
jgi:hypothetical protein